MNARSCFVLLALLALGVLGSCQRLPSSAASIGPLPPTAGDASEAPIVPNPDASPEAGPLVRPVGRQPRAVMLEGTAADSGFAELAAPSAEHPRGTIAVAVSHWVPKPGASGEAKLDVQLVEIDVATAAPVRALDAGRGLSGYSVVAGTSGPIGVNVEKGATTVAWFDRALGERLRHTFKTPLSLESLCAVAAVGDRVLLADCGAKPLPVWVLDPSGTATVRRCPGGSSTGLWIHAWGPNMALVQGLHGRQGRDAPCAFRADGQGGVIARDLPATWQTVARDGRAYVYVGAEDHTFALGPDLRPTGPASEYPEGPPEVAAAQKITGLSSALHASFVNGAIVLEAAGCCEDRRANLWILDPHAEED